MPINSVTISKNNLLMKCNSVTHVKNNVVIQLISFSKWPVLLPHPPTSSVAACRSIQVQLLTRAAVLDKCSLLVIVLFPKCNLVVSSLCIIFYISSNIFSCVSLPSSHPTIGLDLRSKQRNKQYFILSNNVSFRLVEIR